MDQRTVELLAQDTAADEYMKGKIKNWDSYDLEERTSFIKLMQTFGDQPDVGVKLINYVLSQLNTDTLRGYVNYNEFQWLHLKSSSGAYKLLFLQLHDEKAPKEKWNEYFARRQVALTQVNNLLYLLLTRVYEGRDYRLKLAEIDSKKPVNYMVRGD